MAFYVSGFGPLKQRRTVARAVVLVLFTAVLAVDISAGELYKAGDSTGWTIMGTPNYTAWASSKTFHVGDIIVFQYNKQFHNVLEVTKADYKACNNGSPIATYTSGNDSIVLKRKGHHFFLCGVPGHCQIGQKVDIRIRKVSAAAGATTPSLSPSAPSSPTSVSTSAPSSPTSRASTGGGGRLGWVVAFATATAGAAFIAGAI